MKAADEERYRVETCGRVSQRVFTIPEENVSENSRKIPTQISRSQIHLMPHSEHALPVTTHQRKLQRVTNLLLLWLEAKIVSKDDTECAKKQFSELFTHVQSSSHPVRLLSLDWVEVNHISIT